MTMPNPLRRTGALALATTLSLMGMAPAAFARTGESDDRCLQIENAEPTGIRPRVLKKPQAPTPSGGNIQISPNTKLKGDIFPMAGAGDGAAARSIAGPQSAQPIVPSPLQAPLGQAGNISLSPQKPIDRDRTQTPSNTENFNVIDENPFLRPTTSPLSTFSIDVDTASYSKMRQFINNGTAPPKDAVRLEELVNYFPYRYPQPDRNQPFSVTTDVTQAPWNPQHKLVRIGLKGKQIEPAPPSNLVFLIDVSGSMSGPGRLPLVQRSLCLLTQQLKAQDRVTLVVYAGSAGVVLSPTPGDQKAKILEAIANLRAGGSTAGGEGIALAYKKAEESFIKGGNNRVILATDGDFNVGVSSDAELVRMIEQKRDRGIFLTVLGFGMGNYKDGKMEQLADKGNGNYAYIDTFSEAKKVLVNDLRGTLFTIAKDVKIQVEMNPAKVQAYRLIGYENRALRDQDFNDDRKDAGEIGAGHTVTALYEIISPGVTDVKLPDIDGLKYQKPQAASAPGNANELMQVKLRYKEPMGNSSELISRSVIDRVTPLEQASEDLQFVSSVVMFGMVLRDSEFKGKTSLESISRLAEQGKGADAEGYREEFIALVKGYRAIKPMK
jgi:Ca-activated chloride channel homolog